MKSGCKTVVDILIGMVLGVVLFIGAIVGTVYALIASFTVGQVQDSVGVEVFKGDSTVNIKDMTLLEVVQELVGVFSDLGNVTIGKLVEDYGLPIPTEVAGLDITGIFDVPLPEVPNNLTKILDKVTLADVSTSFSITLPDIDIINESVSLPVMQALQNVMDEVDGIDKRSLGELDSMFGLGIFDGEGEVNKTLLALKDTPLTDFSSALNTLCMSDLIEIDRDYFVAVGLNTIYERVDRYELIPETELETFVGDKYRLKITYTEATAEQLAATDVAKFVYVEGAYVAYDAANADHADLLKYVEASRSFVCSGTGTYKYTEYEAVTQKVADTTYYIPTYVDNVTVTELTSAPDPVTYGSELKQLGYIDISTLFVDTNAAANAYTVGTSLADAALNADGKLDVGAYLVRRDAVVPATDPETYTYEELGGFGIVLDTVDPTDLKGDLEEATVPADVKYLRSHIGTSDALMQVIADVTVGNAGNVADIIKDEKLKVLLDIVEEDQYSEATAEQLANTSVVKYVVWDAGTPADTTDDLYVPYDSTESTHEALTKYVRTAEKSSSVLIALADVSVDGMSDALDSLTIGELMDVNDTVVYRPATTADLANSSIAKYVVWDAGTPADTTDDLYVPYDSAESTHAALTKYVIYDDKDSSVLVALETATLDTMSDSLDTLTMSQLMDITEENVYRPATASDTDTSLHYFYDSVADEYVAYADADASLRATQAYVIHDAVSARVLVSLKDSTLLTMSDDITNLTLAQSMEIDNDEFALSTYKNYNEGKAQYVLSASGMYIAVTADDGTFSSYVTADKNYSQFSGTASDGVTYTDSPCYVRTKNGDSHVVIKQMAGLKINDLGSEMSSVIDTLKLSDIMDINECAKVYEGVSTVRDELVDSGVLASDIVEYTLVAPYQYDDEYVYIKSDTGAYCRTQVRYVELSHLEANDTASLVALAGGGTEIVVKVVRMTYASNDLSTTPTLTVEYVAYDPSATINYVELTTAEKAAYDLGVPMGTIYSFDGTNYVVFTGTASTYASPLYKKTNDNAIYQNYAQANDADVDDYTNGGSTVLYFWDSTANGGDGGYVLFTGDASTTTYNLYVYTTALFIKETSATPDFYVDYDAATAAADGAYTEGGAVVRYAKKYVNDILYNVDIDLTGGTPMVSVGTAYEAYDAANAAHADLPVVYLAYFDGTDYVVETAYTVGRDYLVVQVDDAVEGKMMNYDASAASAHVGLDTYVTVKGYLTPATDGDQGTAVYLVKGDEASEKVLVSFKTGGATVSTLNSVIGTLSLGDLVVVEPDTILDNDAIRQAQLTSIGSDLKTGFSGATLSQMILWGGYATMDPVVEYMVGEVAVSDFFAAISATISLPNLRTGAGDIVMFTFDMNTLSQYMCYTVEAYDSYLDVVTAIYSVVANERA